MKILAISACALALSSMAWAADHGPVFSYATPVNAEREFSFDTGVFGRSGPAGTQLSTGSGFGYGVTPHLTVNAFVPAMFGNGPLPESRLVPGGEWSLGTSWRFLHSVTSVGKRLESTASVALVVPGPQPDPGVVGSLHRAPGVAATVASGLASRSQYFWLGGGYTGFAEEARDRRPGTVSWSAVYGYRPPQFRRGVDKWDYRGFAEFTGERTGPVLAHGADLPGSGTTTLWLGPSVLAILKNVAISGGAQAPIYRDAPDVLYGRERFRFAINFSYLKYSSHAYSH